MANVTVIANPKTGKVFNQNANLGKDGKAYGWFLVESSVLDTSGPIVSIKRRTAVKAISKEAYDAAAGLLQVGSQLPGKIVVREALEPFYDGQKAKTAGEGGEVCTFNGNPIYRETEFTSDLSASDELIAHTNVITGSSVAASKNDLAVKS
jgi:hypothetical protein